MSLFSNIYNTVAKFFRPQEDSEDASKSVATNRLKLVLMQDRTNLTPRILEQMRGELIDLLSRYVELDKELLDLNFEQEGNQVALMLSIPVIRAKDEDEIEAAIKEHEESIKAAALKENSEEITEKDEVKETSDETQLTEITDERTEEEKVEADKADAIANELNDVPKIIKHKEKSDTSKAEHTSSNPFKSDVTENESEESLETPTEA